MLNRSSNGFCWNGKAQIMNEAARKITLFVVGRFPFVHALTLLMLLGERATRETYPPFAPRVIYVHLGVLVVCGVCMSFDMLRKSSALIHSGQLLYMAFSVYTSDKLKYNHWTKIRMAHRLVGVAACYVLYSFFNSSPPRNQQLRRTAELLLGIYTMIAVYTLAESEEDKTAFLELFPGGMWVYYCYVLLYCAFCLCYLPGYFVYDVSQVFIVLLVLITLFVDCDISYWTNKRGMDFWNQIRLITDNVNIVFGLLLYLTCTKKKVHFEKED